MIFITAKTLDSSGATYKDVLDPRVLHEMKVLPSEIPGYQVPQETLDSFDAVAKNKNDLEELKWQSQLANEKLALNTLQTNHYAGMVD